MRFFFCPSLSREITLERVWYFRVTSEIVRQPLQSDAGATL